MRTDTTRTLACITVLQASMMAASGVMAQVSGEPRERSVTKPDAGEEQVLWAGYNGGYDATRYSKLTQINTGNVGQLAEVARFTLPETLSFQCGPVVVGTTMFITTPKCTYAIDAKSGAQRWMRDHKPKSMGLGTPVRGVAYANGRIFRGTPDGRVICMDATSGDVVWDVQDFDPEAGEYLTAAPVVWEGRVYVPNAGSDVGAIGRIRAFDVETGKRVWNFDIVPTSGPAADTWSKENPRAGGGVYASMALDEETGTIYSPTGNPGPDFVSDYRPGDNLYTCSVVMLDARTGSLRGYRQFVKNDHHDWDVAASPCLFTSKAGKKMVAVAGKNGYLYGLDRELKNEQFKVAVTGIENVDAPITKEGTRFKPGTQGGTNWYGPTYSPQTNAIYVPAIDWATTVVLGGPESLELTPGKPWIGSANSFGDQDPKSQRRGHVTAVDADSGKIIWQYDTPEDCTMVASVTPTAGGLVLTGDTQGNFIAFDAKTGQVLLKKPMGDPIGGGVITYELGGTQYIAVPGGMKNAIVQTESGPAWVAILALPGEKR